MDCLLCSKELFASRLDYNIIYKCDSCKLICLKKQAFMSLIELRIKGLNISLYKKSLMLKKFRDEFRVQNFEFASINMHPCKFKRCNVYASRICNKSFFNFKFYNFEFYNCNLRNLILCKEEDINLLIHFLEKAIFKVYLKGIICGYFNKIKYLFIIK